MLWINISKKIMSMEYVNKKLTFLSMAVLIQNLEKIQNVNFIVSINEHRIIDFSRYE